MNAQTKRKLNAIWTRWAAEDQLRNSYTTYRGGRPVNMRRNRHQIKNNQVLQVCMGVLWFALLYVTAVVVLSLHW